MCRAHSSGAVGGGGEAIAIATAANYARLLSSPTLYFRETMCAIVAVV